MAGRATYSTEEATELLFSSVLESEGESDIEDDPNFPFPSLSQSSDDDEVLQSDAPIVDDQLPPTPERPFSPSGSESSDTTSNATIHKL